MRAAVLNHWGSPLSIDTLPDPSPSGGGVVIDIAAAKVLPYAREVFSGERRYLLELPIAPGTGAIGRVRSVGPDATRLAPGDWVTCDPTVRSRDGGATPDIALQGLTARGEGGLKLQRQFHHGSFAEQMLTPTENVFPIGRIEPADAGRWTALNLLLVPFGGLLAAGLQPGETALISGATGNFGSAGVAAALGMGAGCVVAPGRNQAMLHELSRRFGSRVRTVTLTGDEAEDVALMKGAAPDGVDCVLDILPPSAPASAARAALMSVREFGRVVLMGGIGGAGGGDLALPYAWIMRNNVTIRGQWMYPPSANTRLIAMVRAGLIDLSHWAVTEFPLDQANDAVEHAASDSGPFRTTVIRP